MGMAKNRKTHVDRPSLCESPSTCYLIVGLSSSFFGLCLVFVIVYWQTLTSDSLAASLKSLVSVVFVKRRHSELVLVSSHTLRPLDLLSFVVSVVGLFFSRLIQVSVVCVVVLKDGFVSLRTKPTLSYMTRLSVWSHFFYFLFRYIRGTLTIINRLLIMVIYKAGDIICQSEPDVYSTHPEVKGNVCDRCFEFFKSWVVTIHSKAHHLINEFDFSLVRNNVLNVSPCSIVRPNVISLIGTMSTSTNASIFEHWKNDPNLCYWLKKMVMVCWLCAIVWRLSWIKTFAARSGYYLTAPSELSTI